LTQIAGTDASSVATVEGAVSDTTDNGHMAAQSLLDMGIPWTDASVAMNPDGTINTTLWRDFSERSLHELAVKTKALTKAYYG
ncbi:hypothetical protein K3X43_14730, partial [Listeria monocytogenes]|nr:hypothetical protein [Listeria monocytogenes]